MATRTIEQPTVLAPVSNGAKELIESNLPYSASITIKGVAPYLFKGWNNEAVKEQGEKPKGSKSKKTDNLEASVYRLANGNLGMSQAAMCKALQAMGRFKQDPRSARKSALDLVKAGVFPLDDLADTGVKDWDYVDRRRAVIQHSAITRARPALAIGWQVTFKLLVSLPEYITPTLLLELASEAGKLNGMGDYRPTFGRFQVVRFEVAAIT